MSGYADGRDVVRDAFAALRPPVRMTVAEYALRNRRLANEGGGYVGRWTHDTAPYLVEPMECLTSLQYQTLAIVGPGQCGKTTIAENWMLKAVDDDPGDILWYMQTDPGLEAYVKGRINPMIEQHPVMASRIGHQPVDNSLHFKRFRGMKVEFLSATYNNLINKSAPRIIADEIDAYPQSLGDLKAVLDVRRQTFGRRSKLVAISHPDLARGVNPNRDWTAGIMAIYADSDRRVWYWQCPHCGGWSSPAPIADRVMTISYPEDGTLDEIESQARLLCPVAGCLIEDEWRPAMNAGGRWVGLGQTMDEDGTVTGEMTPRRTAGWWIVGVMSPFLLGGIGALARARAKAEREYVISGDDGTLRQVVVKQWGIPYSRPRVAGSVDANTLAERAEQQFIAGRVPEGVRFLTATADVQAAHFEWLVRGFGVGGESWVIDKGRLLADPATSPDDWDELLREVFQRTYPLADGSGRTMAIRACGYDSGGQPGVTQQAYAAWTRWRREKAIRSIGKVAGKDVYSILPLKGARTPNAPRITVSYPDTKTKANRRSGAGAVPLLQFNPNQFKDDLAGQLAKAEAGPLYVHVPASFRSKEPPHHWFEQLTAEQPDAAGRWKKVVATARNEATDLMVMSHAVAMLHGLTRIDWARPPAWADVWDKNALVSTPVVIETESPRVPPRGRTERKRSLIDRLA
jgi:phage terminase large subunit GpA-like protein